jgi:hypothetical protein
MNIFHLPYVTHCWCRSPGHHTGPLWRLARERGFKPPPDCPEVPLSWFTLQFLWSPASCQSGEGAITRSNQFWRHVQCSPPVTCSNLLSVFPLLNASWILLASHACNYNSELQGGKFAVRNQLYNIWLSIKSANHPNPTCRNTHFLPPAWLQPRRRQRDSRQLCSWTVQLESTFLPWWCYFHFLLLKIFSVLPGTPCLSHQFFDHDSRQEYDAIPGSPETFLKVL